MEHWPTLIINSALTANPWTWKGAGAELNALPSWQEQKSNARISQQVETGKKYNVGNN